MPRLVVAAYATVKRTDLFFRQAVGRVVRRRSARSGRPRGHRVPPRRPDAHRLRRARRGRAAPAGQRRGRRAFDVEPPPGLARRADFQPLDAQVEPGGMIVAGVHYARGEVDAARRLLRELGQSERALRSVLEFVRRERVGGAAGRRPRRSRRTAASSTSGARSTALPAAGRSCDARSTPRTPGRRRRRASTARWASARRADAGEAQLDDGLAFLRSELAKLAARPPRAGRATAHPRQRRGDRRARGDCDRRALNRPPAAFRAPMPSAASAVAERTVSNSCRRASTAAAIAPRRSSRSPAAIASSSERLAAPGSTRVRRGRELTPRP